MTKRNIFFAALSFFLLAISLKAQEIVLYNQFLGKYDFTMIGNTLNDHANTGSDPQCYVLSQSSAQLNLTPNQDVIAAYLYWAGSGSLSEGDLDVKLNGIDMVVDRTFTTNLANRPVYGAFSDITPLVQATGNGTYIFSDFDLSGVINGDNYCLNGTNFGGWSILIIYTDPDLTNNLVNIYDGFERVDSDPDNQDLEVTLTNLNVLHLVGNRVGFLSWEGDGALAFNESLSINNNIVSNFPLNPANNVFNGTNSFTGSNQLYNMDLDYFDINDFTNIGDNSLVVKLHSGNNANPPQGDAIIINNLVLVLNSEVPDATVNFETAVGPCDIRDINVDYTVHNTIATDILPASTPIAFYAGTTLVGTSATVNDIPIGGSEDNSIVLTIPGTVPNSFTLTVKVDDDGTGNSTIIEFQEDNNTDEVEILLGTTPTPLPADGLVACDSNNDGQEIFDLTVPGNQMLGTQTGVTVRYYEDENDADAGNADNIPTPNAYANTSDNQIIYVRMEDPAGCSIVSSFTIQITPPALLTYNIPPFEECSQDDETTGIETDLTTHNPEILNGSNPALYTITYHLNQADAMSGNAPIANPDLFQNTSSPQIIWVRLITADGCVQYGSFEIIYHPSPIIHATTLQSCSLEGPGTFILSDANPEIVDDITGLDFSYHASANDADNNEDPLPNEYVPGSELEIVYVRVTTEFGCHAVIGVILQTVINTAQLTNVYEVCDDPYRINNGTAEFDLTTYETQVANALTIPGAIVTYYLTQEDAGNGMNAISNPEHFVNTVNPQTIYARAANPEGGCGGIAEFQIEVLPVPEFEMPEYIAFCKDDEKIYTFDGDFSSYSWTDENGNIISTNSTATFENSGTYTLEVTETPTGCPAKRDVEVILDNAPVITEIDINGQTVTVFASGGEGPYEYSYNNGLSWHDYYVLSNVPDGIHYMLVRSKYGCISDSKIFGVLGIPNVITPNGDGYNDYWEIRALELYPDSHIKIFDRYGKIFVDREIGADFKWDGKYNGSPIPSGDYWYILTIGTGESISGHISVRNRN